MQSPNTAKVLSTDSLKWNASPRTFPQLKGAASSNLWASSRAVHNQSSMDKDKQNPSSFASSQGKPEEPSHLQNPLGIAESLSAHVSQDYFSLFLVLLPSCPPWYYQKHSPINFLQTYLHLKIYFLGTQPKIDFHCSPHIILPLRHQNWFFY